ncbi:hypothetical protein NFC82_19530, partial [Pseudomonas koreensis]|nr:hypothetical protein [Pseudomonas koreensis]
AGVSFWLAYMHLLLMLCPNTKFLTPSPTEAFEWFKVDRAIGNVRNQGSDLIKPIEATTQGGLF